MLGIVLIFILLQSLLFLSDETLSGKKQLVYVFLKVLKNCTKSKAKSFEIKFAVDQMLRNKDHENIELGPAIRLVMTHSKIKGKFDSIHPDLEKMGFTGVEVTDQGFRFVRNSQAEGLF